MNKLEFYKILKVVNPIIADNFYSLDGNDYKLTLKDRVIEFTSDTTLTITNKVGHSVFTEDFDISSIHSKKDKENFVYTAIYGLKPIELIKKGIKQVLDKKHIDLDIDMEKDDEFFINWFNNNHKYIINLLKGGLDNATFEIMLPYISEQIEKNIYHLNYENIFIYYNYIGDVDLTNKDIVILIDCVGNFSNGSLVYSFQNNVNYYDELKLINCNNAICYGNKTVNLYGDTHAMCYGELTVNLYNCTTCVAEEYVQISTYDYSYVSVKSESVIGEAYNHSCIVAPYDTLVIHKMDETATINYINDKFDLKELIW